MLDYEGEDFEDVFMQTFLLSYKDVFGSTITQELKEKGNEIPVTKLNKKVGGGMVKWLTRQASNLMIASRVDLNPIKLVIVSLSKKLYTQCSVLVGSRNQFESVSISL
jgi:hypothetical protein